MKSNRIKHEQRDFRHVPQAYHLDKLVKRSSSLAREILPSTGQMGLVNAYTISFVAKQKDREEKEYMHTTSI